MQVSTRFLVAAGAVTVLAVSPLSALMPQAWAQSAKTTDSGSYGPVVAIITPQYGDVLRGETDITIAIQSRLYPARSVELLVDGRAVSGVLPVQSAFKWKTTQFVDGPHSLMVRVTDSQGFIGQSETLIYINNENVRTTAPDVSTVPSVGNPSNPATPSGPTSLRWLGIVSGSKLSGEVKVGLEPSTSFGVKYVFLNLNKAITPNIKPSLASWMTNRPPYEFNVDTSKFEDGLYVLDALAYNALQEEVTAPRLTVGFFNHGMNGSLIDEGLAKVNPPTPTTIGSAQVQDTAPDKNNRVNKNTSPNDGDTFAMNYPNGKIPVNPVMSFTSPRYDISVESQAATTSRTSTTIERENSYVTYTSSARISDMSGSPRYIPPAKTTTDVPSMPASVKPLVKTNTSAPAGFPLPSLPNVNTGSELSQPAIGNLDFPNQSERSGETRTLLSNLPSQERPPQSTQLPPQPHTTASANREAGTPRQAASPSGTIVPTHINDSVTGAALSTPLAEHGTRISNSGALVTEPQTSSRALFSDSQRIAAAPHRSGQPVMSTHSGEPVGAIIAESNSPDLAATRATLNSALATAPPARFSFLPKEFTPKPVRSQSQRSTVDLSVSGEMGVASRITAAAANRPGSALHLTSEHKLATAPRLAMAPDIKWRSPDKTKFEAAAIVVSPNDAARPNFLTTHNETLGAIAARFKVPVSALATANDWTDKSSTPVAAGTRVLLPQTLTISYKGQKVTGDVAPLLMGSTSVAPFRFLFEKQGGNITWNGNAQRVVAKNKDYEVELSIGSDKAIVNQKEVLMDMAAFLVSGRTMVPVRFFEKALHAKVEWEPSTGRIYVASLP